MSSPYEAMALEYFTRLFFRLVLTSSPEIAHEDALTNAATWFMLNEDESEHLEQTTQAILAEYVEDHNV
jgi:hypothetical protein